MGFTPRTLVVAVILSACGVPGEEAGLAHQPSEIAEPPRSLDRIARKAPTTSGWRERPIGLPLTSGQVLAIGRFSDCSGVLITPTWILSAAHCAIPSEDMFCIGPEPETPDICLRVKRVVRHSQADIALVELAESSSKRAPGVEPIPVLAERLDDSYLDRTVQLAGYGIDAAQGGKRGRRFASEPITSLLVGTIIVGGTERQGECYGGSGGPAFVMASDGSVGVAGSLTLGSPTCIGPDVYTRVDVHRKWIEEQTMAP